MSFVEGAVVDNLTKFHFSTNHLKQELNLKQM